MLDLFEVAATPPTDHGALIVAYKEAHQRWIQTKSKADLAEKYAALDDLKDAGLAPGAIGIENFDANRIWYHSQLQQRAHALDLDLDWLNTRFEQEGVDATNLTESAYISVSGQLDQLEDHCRLIDKEKAKNARKTERKQEQVGKGGDLNDGSLSPAKHYDSIRSYAEQNGITSDEFLRFAGPIKWDLRGTIPKRMQVSKEICEALEAKMVELVALKKEQPMSKQPCPPACPEGCPNHKQVNLFDEVEQTVDENTGEVAHVPTETPRQRKDKAWDYAKGHGLDVVAIWNNLRPGGHGNTTHSLVDEFIAAINARLLPPKKAEPVMIFGDDPEDDQEYQRDELTPELRAQIARRLGIPNIEIKSKEDADRILARRAAFIAELTLVTQNFVRMKAELEGDIKAIGVVFDAPLETWTKANVPDGKKSIKLLHGELKLRDQPESISKDSERDPDEKQYQAWLASQDDNFKSLYDIRSYTRYSCSHDAIKDWYKRSIHAAVAAKQPLPVVPGLTYTPPAKNKFSISPSLDMIKKNIKESLEAK